MKQIKEYGGIYIAMKKTVIGVIFLIIGLLTAGCAEDRSASEQPEPQTEKTASTEQKEETITVEASEDTGDLVESEQEEVKKTPTYQLQENWNIKPINESDNEKVVLLTIDDAPDKHALEMARTLKELDAKAIFFVNGHFLDTEKEKETLKEIYDMGFEIGNHTYNHQALPEVDETVQEEEIIALSDLVEEITGERPKFFRAPHGMNTDFSKQLVKEEGMLLMNWTYGYDWEQEYMTGEAIADIMINTELLSDGSNLLMHDREWTSEGLTDIVTGLREKGFEILDPDLIETTTE